MDNESIDLKKISLHLGEMQNLIDEFPILHTMESRIRVYGKLNSTLGSIKDLLILKDEEFAVNKKLINAQEKLIEIYRELVEEQSHNLEEIIDLLHNSLVSEN